MATIAVDPARRAEIEQLERLGFEAVPAKTIRKDGSWIIRLDPDYAAKRVNSINPMDLDDCDNVHDRLMRAAKIFTESGKQIVLRQTPLCPPRLVSHLKEKKWKCFDESIVMLSVLGSDKEYSQHPGLQPVETKQWVEIFSELSGIPSGEEAGLLGMIGSVKARQGLFFLNEQAKTIAAGRCVVSENHAGVFDIVTGREFRGQGFGNRLTGSMLRWALSQSCSSAWLQVVADNQSAISLYQRFGFEEVYRYCYWTPAAELRETNDD